MARRKPKVLNEQVDAKSSPGLRWLRLLRRNLQKEGFSWEPVANLPPEIATMCLQYALPSSASGDYPLRLLDLTTVSRRWESFLFSTPSFWSTIHVKYTNHDLMATIALFAHLSGRAALQIVVCNDLGHEWNAVKSLLLPHTHRINAITLGDNPPIYSQSPFGDLGYISLATNIVKSFGCLPSLSEIDFGRRLELRPSQLTGLDLPSNARVINSIEVSLRNEAVGSLFLTPFVGDGASDNARMDYEHSIRYKFVRKNELGAVDDKSTTIRAINSGISSLTDALNLLDNRLTSTDTLASSPCANFISGTRCMLCKREKYSLLRLLGCVRSHFEVRPFQCTGCSSCNAANGFARFYTSQQLSNHSSQTCAVCGTRASRGLEPGLGEETICDRCDPRSIEAVLGLLHEEGKKIWPNDYHDYVILPALEPMPADLEPGRHTDLSLWTVLYAEAMRYMKPIITRMGLFFQKCGEKTEMGAVIQKSVILLRQRIWIAFDLFLPIPRLEEMIQFFRPRFQEFQEQIRGIVVLPQALSPLVNRSEVDHMALWGLISSEPDEQVWLENARNVTGSRHRFECAKSFNGSFIASENT